MIKRPSSGINITSYHVGHCLGICAYISSYRLSLGLVVRIPKMSVPLKVKKSKGVVSATNLVFQWVQEMITLPEGG